MVVIIVTNNTLRHYGKATIYGSDIPLAIAGILAKLNSIVVAFVVGLALGCQQIWSFNMGAKQYDRVKDTYRFGLKRNLMISMTAFVLLQLFPRQIIGIFGGGSELYFEFGVRYIRIFMLMIGLFGVQPLTINYFTSTGNVKNGLLLTISRHGLFLLPLLLILPPFMGPDGALIAGPIADIPAFARPAPRPQFPQITGTPTLPRLQNRPLGRSVGRLRLFETSAWGPTHQKSRDRTDQHQMA